MTPYGCEALPDDNDTIRPLVLHPSKLDTRTFAIGGDIYCDLFDPKISENPSYEAVSYTWAGPNADTGLCTSARMQELLDKRESLYLFAHNPQSIS
jgi:hypothetical protein